jgi:hypothetical protein
LQREFEFDAIDWGRKTAAVILAVSLIGVISSFLSFTRVGSSKLSAFLSALCAIALAVEQLMRLDSFRRGQKAGSVLGALIRPFVRDLFIAEEPEKDEQADRSPLR